MKNFIPDSVSEHTNVFDVLKERGFIEQTTTDEEVIRELLGKEKIKFYIGFDPTADCLHGHGGRPFGPSGHASDDDRGHHRQQLRPVQEAL